MSEKDPIRLFVTHTFEEHEEYSRVFEYLESRDNFFYINFSNPEAKPEPATQEAVQEEIRKQIQNTEVVVFPVGVHASNPALLDFELRVAKAFDKPILAIKAFGGTLTVAADVLATAAEVVEWNDRVITEAIGRLARGEDKEPWDVIEFDMD